MAAGDTYEIVLKATCQGQLVVNTLYARAEAAGDLSQHGADTWNTSLLATWRACHTPDYTLTTIACRQINPPGPVAYERAPTSSTGTLANPASSLTSCAVVKFTSAYIGRSRRGRNFVGPFGDGGVEAGLITTGFTTAVNAYYAALDGLWGQGGSDSTNLRWVVWSRKIASTISQLVPPAMGSSASASAYVVSYHTDTIARVLRRRELGVGS